MKGPLAAAVGLVLLLGVGVYAFVERSGCDREAIALDVAVAPDIAPAVTRMTGRFNDAGHQVDGRCVRATVRRADPASVATLLSGQGVASGGNRTPDIWLPDSSLWTVRARGSTGGGKGTTMRIGASVAQSPIVVALPRTLAARLQAQGITDDPSWHNLLQAIGATAGGAVTKYATIPPDTVRLLVPDPARNAAGLTSLVITSTLLVSDPNRDSILAGIVRTARENTQPTVQAQFAQFKPRHKGKFPIALAPEQAVWAFNRTGPAEPAVALYPFEGTLSMDHPFTVIGTDGAKQKAARLLERAMTTAEARAEVRGLGFRSPDGKAPSSYGIVTGVSARRPRQLPAPQPADVTRITQAWLRLALGLRILTLVDVSGTMAEPMAPGITRLQATARTAQGGLSMMPDDTELGLWTFSTKLQGDQDWRELVPAGPLGERAGSATRRQLVLSALASITPKKTGDTGLFETLMAAYKQMSRTYKPEYSNAIVLLTDGKGNDDPGGPSLRQTLATLKKETDPARPIDVIMIGVGQDVDTRELTEIAKIVPGFVYVARTPGQITKIFLQAMATHIQR